MVPFLRGLAASEGGVDPLPSPPMALATLEQRIRTLGERSLAPATRKKYDKHLQTFKSVLSALHATGMPPDKQVQTFIVWAKDANKSQSWVSSHLAAFSHHSKLDGRDDPTRSFAIRAALKGWAREEVRTPDDREPIDFHTLQALLDVVRHITSSPFEGLLFSVAFCLAFFEAFRVSELVAKAKADMSGAALDIQDVCLTAKLVLRLRKSKTDQAGKGFTIVLEPLGDSRYCPVALVRE